MNLTDLLSGFGEGIQQPYLPPAIGNAVVTSRPEHRGLFGLKGTPRDILGILGDALMMNSGMNPMYLPTRQGERISDAMGGFEQNPAGAIQAITAINPALGQKYKAQYEEGQLAKATAAARQADSDRTYGLNRDKFSYEQTRDKAQDWLKIEPGIMGTLAGADAKSYPEIRKKALMVAERYGQVLDLPETPSDADRALWRNRAVSPQTQAQIEATNQRAATQAGIAQQRADAYTKQTGRPREVDSYTGEDGYRYTTWSDGTTTRSAQKAAPQGSRRPGRAGTQPASAVPPGAPPPRKVGDKIRDPNGAILVSKDGKTWTRE